MKDVKKAYGICPASMTIWNDDETYNKKGMEKYLRWLIDQGAQSISVCGSTGENIAMNINEQLEIIDHTVRFLDGEVPVIVGSGTYSTKNTIIMSQAAEKAGADGVMLILPFYLHPYKEAVKRHFREIRKNLDIDIMVYNNPWFAGYELNPHEVKELVDDGTVQLIKAAHGDPNRVHELKYLMGDKLQVFYGHDYCAMEGIMAGADGWLSGFPGVLPKACRTLQDIITIEKDIDKANAYQKKMFPYIDYFFNDKKDEIPHWQEICKYTLKAQGLDYVGLPRHPLTDLDDANKKKIDKLLADLYD